MRVAAITILTFLGVFTGTAFAAQAVPDNTNILDLAKPLLDAVVHGQFWLAAACAVMLLCAAARRFLPEKYRTGTLGDVVAIGINFSFAFAGAVVTVLATPGAAMTVAVAFAALKVALAAAGGFGILHKLAGFVVETKFYKEHVPAPVKTVVALILAAIGSSAVEKAKAAGEAAVQANPSTGMKGTDDIEEVE